MKQQITFQQLSLHKSLVKRETAVGREEIQQTILQQYFIVTRIIPVCVRFSIEASQGHSGNYNDVNSNHNFLKIKKKNTNTKIKIEKQQS